MSVAVAHGIDPATFLRVAQCESTLDPTVVNASSGALGLFQHLPQYWGGRAAALGYSYDQWADPSVNAHVSAVLWTQHGPQHWSCY